jgi:hypothetical protein
MQIMLDAMMDNGAQSVSAARDELKKAVKTEQKSALKCIEARKRMDIPLIPLSRKVCVCKER